MTTIRIVALPFTMSLLLFSAARAQEQQAKAPASSTEWRSLFDGRSLDGWEHVGPGKFVVEDGVMRTEGGMGLLWYTREKLGDCVLRVVYKTANDRSNSGVYIRIADRPTEPWFAVHHGFEVQIFDTSTNNRGTGSIYTFAKAAARPAKAGEWNTLEVTLKGQTIATTINGVKVAVFDSTGLEPEKTPKSGEGDPGRGPRPEMGYIGLQNHDEKSIVSFKELSVRPLASASK
jgi:hypothetical protein